MAERRFNETEVAEIFARAAEAVVPAQRQLAPSEGMTLGQLQEIARDVGISSEQIAQAAQAIEVGGRATSRSFLGLPVGVGVSIDLGRKLTDEEWESVVVDLRETVRCARLISTDDIVEPLGRSGDSSSTSPRHNGAIRVTPLTVEPA